MSRTAFREAVEAKDWETALESLSDDVTFWSPVVFKPYRGKAEVSALLGFVSQVFEDFHYIDQLESGDSMALIFEAKVGDRDVQGLDLLRFDSDDKITEFTVMVRPMSGMHALAEAMRVKLEAAGAV